MPINNNLETPPGVAMSNYDVERLLQRRRRLPYNTVATEQESPNVPKPSGYATTGIEGYIQPLYAGGNNVNIDAYMNDAQLNELSGGDPEKLLAFKAIREKKYGVETYQAAQDKRLRQLQLDEMNVQKGQAQLEKTASDLESKQSKSAFEEEERPIKLAKERAELRKLESEATLSEDKVKRREELRSILEQPEQQIATTAPEAPADTAQNIMDMDTINTYPWPGWNNIKSLAQSHNVPNDVLYGMHLGRLATTYNNPMQLVRDVNIKLPEGLSAVSEKEVQKYYTDIATQWNEGATPDNALTQILKDSGIEKSSPNYAQTALAIAYGIQKRYSESGEDALSEAKRAISQANAESFNKTVPKLTEVQANVATADGVREFVLAPQKLLQEADILDQSNDSEDKIDAARLRQRGMQQLGLYGNPRSMSSEEIKLAVIDNMIPSYQDNPQTLQYLEAQKNPKTRDPRFDQSVGMIVPMFRKGAEAWELAEAKEQDKRDKIVKDYSNQDQEVYFDPKTNEPHILPLGSLAQMEQLSSPERAGYLQRAEVVSRRQLADPNFREFIKKSDDEKKDIRESLSIGQLILSIPDPTTQMSLMTTAIYPALKGFKPVNSEELQLVLNELSRSNGLPPIDASAGQNTKPLDISSLTNTWNAKTGEQQQSSAPVTEDNSSAISQSIVELQNALQNQNFTVEDRQAIQDTLTELQGRTSTVRQNNTAPIEPQKETISEQAVSSSISKEREQEIRKEVADINFTGTDLDSFVERKAKEAGMTISDWANNAIQSLYGLGALAGNVANKGAELVGKAVAWAPVTTVKTARELPTRVSIAIENMMREEEIQKRLAQETQNEKK